MMSVLELTYRDKETSEHIARIHKATFDKYDLADVVRYIEEKTYLNGSKFSFKDHEFQKDIISDTHPDINVQKCAQVGMSEIMARYALAVWRVMPYFSTILTMPGANDASNFFKTRIDAVINDSPDLRGALDTAINNTESKGIGGSLLYGRGTRGSTAALSVPADLLIHDELDRSDPHTIQQYVSRLKHSKWKLIRRFGTPTVNGLGIAAAMAISKRLRHMAKCNHCNHWFAPSYHDHVIIPGFDGDKKEISPHNLMSFDWEKSYLACPKCGLEPSLQYDRREWVCENTDDNFSAKGYYVTPFSVPNVVPVSRIVKESTLFTWHEFCNQTLGETSSETSETLTEDDINSCKYTHGSLKTGETHALGIDMGHICYFTVGRELQDRTIHVVHRRRVPLAQFWEQLAEVCAEYCILTQVWDWQPYTDMVLEAQKTDANLYAGRYVKAANTEIVSIVTKEESEQEGQMPVTVAKISRNLHFDALMYLFKKGRIRWQAQSDLEDTLFIKQMLDMKRVLVPDQYGEGHYEWVKNPNDQDHYHHSLGYLVTAIRLMPAASMAFPLLSVPIARKIRVSSKYETKLYGNRR